MNAAISGKRLIWKGLRLSMLTHLHVKNLAIVEDVKVDFGDNLNILTGETGVGKSVIIGSINIALGAKMSSDIVRTDAEYGLVEMIFELEDNEDMILKEYDIEPEDGMVIIQRKITRGRSVSRINGEVVTLNVLKQIAGKLIDIHGQNEHQSLLYPDNHLAIIDRYDRDIITPLLDEVKSDYSEYMRISKEYKELLEGGEDRDRELAFLEFEKNEIEEAAIKDNEEEELSELYRKLNNAERIVTAVGRAYDYTSAGNGNASDMISSALEALNEVAALDNSVSSCAKMLVDIENILADANHEMAAYIDDFSFDEELFRETEQRLDFIRKILAKYGGSKQSLDKRYSEIVEKYNRFLDYENNKEKLELKLNEAEERIKRSSECLSKAREKASKELEKLIENALKELNFLDVRFSVHIESGETYSPNGVDKVEFMISTNPGEPVKSLGKVASGGELSRIMLAIKSVLAKKDSIHTLIFDEIDTGISGRTAQKVSEKLAVISECHQVICITHLAQIAAMADRHFVIEKGIHEGRTRTDIRVLDDEGIIDELARILGGAEITEAVRNSAAEMKVLANKQKCKVTG